MKNAPRTHGRALPAALTLAALAVTGCSGQSPEAADAGGPVTISLATFGDAPYIEGQISDFEDANPDIMVKWNRAATEADARTNMFTKLAAGSGLSDVEQTEIGWAAQLRENAELFQPVVPDDFGDTVDFMLAPVTSEDGTVFGYGAGTGPTAICYRADLLEAAGMPSDPASVSELVGGSWDDFFAAGETYTAAGGEAAWFDSAYMVFDSQVEQTAFPYETADGDIVADSPEVEQIFRDTLAEAETQSAGLAPFSEDWSAGIGSGQFATMICPSWMLSVVEGNSPGVSTWRVADGFPAGGGNLGGSYWVVPSQSEHPEEAALLASFLSSPERQIEAFAAGGAFPSRVDALDDPALLEVTSSFFDDAPTGQIFADRAQAVDENIFKGPAFIDIDTAVFDAITRVETGQQSVDEAWAQFASEVDALR